MTLFESCCLSLKGSFFIILSLTPVRIERRVFPIPTHTEKLSLDYLSVEVGEPSSLLVCTSLFP